MSADAAEDANGGSAGTQEEEPAKTADTNQEPADNQEAPAEAPADGAGSTEGQSPGGEAKGEQKDEEDSDDAWGDWTKKGKEDEKEEEEEEDEEDGWGDWTKKGVKEGKASSKKKEKIVNPFTLLLQKGKGKGDDSGPRFRRDRGGRRDFRGGKGQGRNLAAQARAEALMRERSAALARAAAIGRSFLHRHVIPPKGMVVPPPRPHLPLNLPPGVVPVPVRPGLQGARPMLVMPKPGMGAAARPGVWPPGAAGPPGVWVPQVPPPPVPFNPAIPPRVPAPSATAAPSGGVPQPPPVRPKQKARPSPRAPAPAAARPRPTSAKPTARPARPSSGISGAMKPPEPSAPPTGPQKLASKTATNGVKRPREEGFAEELREWLHGLDRGRGLMLEYHEVLSTNFGSFQELVERAVLRFDTKMMVFTMPFLKMTGLTKTGHKIMFATGFRKLVNELKGSPAAPAQTPPSPKVSQGREQQTQASPSSHAPRTPPLPKRQQPKPQPKRRPLQQSTMPEEIAELAPWTAEEDEMEEVAVDPLPEQEDAGEGADMDRLWQDLMTAPAKSAPAEEAPADAWAEATEEVPPAPEAAEDEDGAAEGGYEEAPQYGGLHGAYEEDDQEEVAPQAEEEDEELEIPAKVPVPVPAARSRPFTAFGGPAKAFPPRTTPIGAPIGAPLGASKPSVRTARPPAVPPPARLLQGRQPPPEPASPPPKRKEESLRPAQKLRALAEARKKARQQ